LPSVGAPKGTLTCLLLVQEKEEFSENIIQDVAALGITYEKLTHTSDYFPEMMDLAERLIKKGYIYADDTPLEQMREVNVVSAFSPLMTCDEHDHKIAACVPFGWKATTKVVWTQIMPVVLLLVGGNSCKRF